MGQEYGNRIHDRRLIQGAGGARSSPGWRSVCCLAVVCVAVAVGMDLIGHVVTPAVNVQHYKSYHERRCVLARKLKPVEGAPEFVILPPWK